MRCFVLLTFCFVLVYCRSGNDNHRQLGENDRLRHDREDKLGGGSVIGNSFERTTEGSYDRENNRGTGGQLFGSRPGESSKFSHDRTTSGQNSQTGAHGNSQNQFESRPGDQGISGQPVQESTNFRPSQGGNDFSGKPQGSAFGGSRPDDGSTFAQSSGFRPQGVRPTQGSDSSNGFRPTNEGLSGSPTQGSAVSSSSGFRPGNEGQSGGPTQGSSFGSFGESNEGKPNEGSAFGQSSGFRPGNAEQSGRPTQGSSFSSFGGSRPDNEGHSSGRPVQGSQLGGATGFQPGNNGHSSGRPELGIGQSAHEGQTGTVTQRPTSNKEPQQPEDQQTQDGKEDEKDVCFTHIGCFKMGKPWKSALRPLGAPHPPEKIQTVVHFYSRKNPKQPQNITVYPSINLGRAQFDPKKISTIIVHGFSNSGNATWMKDMKDVYLRKVDANVMIVDWGKGAQLLNYLQVAGNTRVVGKELGTFVKYLIEHYQADPGRFHLIGHSLGAQICSYLAKDVPGIARLTALDPAQPGFEGFSKEVRLDQTDAEFVDVIHTDARPFIPTLGFGMMAPHGHVDFYMNGGFDQPGCLPPPKKDLPTVKSFLDFAKFPVETIAKAVACPHARAYEYLIEAFNETDNCIFWGHKTDVKNVFKTVTNTLTQGLFKKFTALSTTCSKDDCIPLGFATKKSPLRGAFVVTTSGRSPFCISEAGVPPETLPQERKEKSFLEKVKETPILG